MSFPDEIKGAVSALDHDTRWKIVELIQEKKRLAYTELFRYLKVRKGTLTHHLNKLMENGILDNYAGENFDDPYSSYYELSRFGKDFISGLLSSIQVSLPFQIPTRGYLPAISSVKINTKNQNAYYTLDVLHPKCLISKEEHAYRDRDDDNLVKTIIAASFSPEDFRIALKKGSIYVKAEY